MNWRLPSKGHTWLNTIIINVYARETKRNRLSCTVKLIEHLIIILVSEWCCRCHVFSTSFFRVFSLRFFFVAPSRLNNIQMQNDFLRQIPRMAEVTLPTNYLDWKSKQLSLPNIKGAQLTSPPGRRDHGFTGAEEPHYVLVRSDDADPRHLGIPHHSFPSDFYQLSRRLL